MGLFDWLTGEGSQPPQPGKRRAKRLPRGWVRYAKTVYKRTPEWNTKGRESLEKQGYRLVK